MIQSPLQVTQMSLLITFKLHLLSKMNHDSRVQEQEERNNRVRKTNRIILPNYWGFRRLWQKLPAKTLALNYKEQQGDRLVELSKLLSLHLH